MATITVETGTGATNSTSYVAVATLTTYIAERNITLGGTNGDSSEILIKSMDFLEQQRFIGTKNTKAQALQWPRFGVVVDSYFIDSDEIPLLLQEAQMEFAISIDLGTDPMAPVSRETKKEKVDVITVEYTDSARAVTFIKSASEKLHKLVRNNNVSFRV